MSNIEKLIPPDLEQCQVMKPNGNTFMTFGGVPGVIRCENETTIIVKETKRVRKKGALGSMAMCDECFEKFSKKYKIGNYVIFKKK